MAISKRKLAANRANAQKSTGAKTAAGKQIVSQNRIVHGLTGQFGVLACESQADYDHLLDQFIQSEKPANPCETQLVVKMAEHTWLAKRALRMQGACFSIESAPPPGEEGRKGPYVGVRTDIDNCVRYHASHDRAYRRASQELLQRRKQRELAERGFESQKRAEAEEARKAELHTIAVATAKLKQQVAEMKAGKAIADMLPPDFTLSDLAAVFPTAIQPPARPTGASRTAMNRT